MLYVSCYTACDENCVSGCSNEGQGNCDTECAPNFYLTSTFECSGELLLYLANLIYLIEIPIRVETQTYTVRVDQVAV